MPRTNPVRPWRGGPRDDLAEVLAEAADRDRNRRTSRRTPPSLERLLARQKVSISPALAGSGGVIRATTDYAQSRTRTSWRTGRAR
jgi:hypothetical protein